MPMVPPLLMLLLLLLLLAPLRLTMRSSVTPVRLSSPVTRPKVGGLTWLKVSSYNTG